MANSQFPDLERRWWIKNYDHDVRPTLTWPRFPAYEILRISANIEPHKAAIDYYGNRISYWNLQLQVHRLANAMIEAGVKKATGSVSSGELPQFVIAFGPCCTPEPLPST